MTLLPYLLKMICCSGLLTGYYWLFLRNRRFHHYNRFFLLAVLLLPVVLPLAPLPGWLSVHPGTRTALSFVAEPVQWADWPAMADVSPAATDQQLLVQPQPLTITLSGILRALYGLVTIVLLFRFAKAMIKIIRLIRSHEAHPLEGFKLYLTTEPGAPFSFFRRIFWDARLDLHSESGRQVLQHELYHARQWHSADVLLSECLSIIGWFNPFFHLVKKELRAIHEFLADQHAAQNGDRFAYATLLVQQAASYTPYPLVHPFFHHQLKRRIAMITQKNSLQYGYLSRIMALPVLLIVGLAVAAKAQQPAEASLLKVNAALPSAVPVDELPFMPVVAKQTTKPAATPQTSKPTSTKTIGAAPIDIAKVRMLMKSIKTMQQVSDLLGEPQEKALTSHDSWWSFKRPGSELRIEFDRNTDTIRTYSFFCQTRQVAGKISYDRAKAIQKSTSSNSIRKDFGTPGLIALAPGQEVWQYQTVTTLLKIEFTADREQEPTVANFSFIENSMAHK